MKNFFADHLSQWYITLSIPLLGLILLWDCVDIAASHGILLRGGDHLNLYYNELLSYIGLLIFSALCMCGAGFYIYSMDKIDIEQRQKEQYHSQVTFYQMLEEQYHSLERLRHDMKNHVIGLQRLLDNQEWDKMSDYLNRMAAAGKIDHADDLTGKSIIDALLYYKRKQADGLHIRWECSVQLPSECPINDFDLCVIFGNLLDNALEACQKLPSKTVAKTERFIRIDAHMVRKCLLLEIVNSAPMQIENLAMPIKHSKYTSGIGLKNVKDAVERYNGTLHVECSEDTFRISILLPCSSAAYDIEKTL
ncbi:MAG: GHKL domain-containing protein [Eubacterium sp.]|nr:GHKL domain-containing protein [Eubacterium sp.]